MTEKQILYSINKVYEAYISVAGIRGSNGAMFPLVLGKYICTMV